MLLGASGSDPNAWQFNNRAKQTILLEHPAQEYAAQRGWGGVTTPPNL